MKRREDAVYPRLERPEPTSFALNFELACVDSKALSVDQTSLRGHPLKYHLACLIIQLHRDPTIDTVYGGQFDSLS